MKPARSPASPGFAERISAMAPAGNVPIVSLLPPIVAAEFGSQFNRTMTGRGYRTDERESPRGTESMDAEGCHLSSV